MKRILFSICVVAMLPFYGCNESIDQTPVIQPNASQSNSSSDVSSAPNETPLDEKEDIVFGDKFPEVLAVTASRIENDNWRFGVTLSSTYDSPERYADAWRVLDEGDNELGIRILGHDHASEQPFTRSGAVQLPDGTSTVFVEGRDQENGWSGQRFEFKLPEN